MFASWLPQNDLLGHKNTKLFITHGGNNGQLEGVVHGVPMLTLPIFGDQFYNAQRAFKRGLGIHLDLESVSVEDLRAGVNEVISNPKYRAVTQRCAQILYDMPNPRKTTVFWVDHVLKFGGSHLKPSVMDMPIWQFLLLDVIAFVFLCGLLAVFLTVLCCRCTFKRCCSPKPKAKAE
jgi:hypothetical protein